MEIRIKLYSIDDSWGKTLEDQLLLSPKDQNQQEHNQSADENDLQVYPTAQKSNEAFPKEFESLQELSAK